MMTARSWTCQFLYGTPKSIGARNYRNLSKSALKLPYRDFSKGAKLQGNKVRVRLFFSSGFAACDSK